MLVASWNVNSIRSRLDRVVDWLERQRPEVLCLQETKVVDETFPFDRLRALGYQIAAYGQKTYNGVAILSRLPLETVARGFDAVEDDTGARLLAATVSGVRIYSVYAPNGQYVGSPAWDVKLEWLARLRAHLARQHRPDEPIVVCGDFNIAPEERDVYDPEFWKRQVLFHPVARAALADLCSFGLVDTFRMYHSEGGLYSWWDYRQLAFPKNLGLRIDHVFASNGLAPLCTAASIDREARKGTGASDHAPVLARFDI